LLCAIFNAFKYASDSDILELAVVVTLDVTNDCGETIVTYADPVALAKAEYVGLQLQELHELQE
jgi:hypothetical protein